MNTKINYTLNHHLDYFNTIITSFRDQHFLALKFLHQVIYFVLNQYIILSVIITKCEFMYHFSKSPLSSN